jgi:hypothetical protein
LSASAPIPLVPTPQAVQLHVHGSLSEGAGSIESGTWEADQLGLDAIWWSEHDWRADYYKHISRFSFDDFEEQNFLNEAWMPLYIQDLGLKSFKPGNPPNSYASPSILIDTQTTPWEGTGSMRFSGASNSVDFSELKGFLASDRWRHKRSLASEVQLEMAMLPWQVSADARPFVHVQLSQHMSAAGVEVYATHALHYFLDNSGATPWRTDDTWFVPVPYTQGQWNNLVLDLTADAAAGFPSTDARDNSFYRMSAGIESRNGAFTDVNFDALHIRHNLEGQALMTENLDMLAHAETLYPNVSQIQGLEISYGPHLNEFGPNIQIPDYEALIMNSGFVVSGGPGKNWVRDPEAMRDVIIAQLVQDAHDRGSLLSFNHMFGTTPPRRGSVTPERMARYLAEIDLYGADLLEVGYRERGGQKIIDFLDVWDELAILGIPLIADGISDTHGDEDSNPVGHWGTRTNNFISWIWSLDSSQASLFEGLKAGRLFFGDPTLFDGTVDIKLGNDFEMGQIVVNDLTTHDISISITGLNSGDIVRIIQSGDVVFQNAVTGTSFLHNQAFAVPKTEDSFYRVEVWEPGGIAKVFSNPIWLPRLSTKRAIRAEQAGIHLDGIVSKEFENFQMTKARISRPPNGSDKLLLYGEAQNGRVVLDFNSAPSLPAQVSFRGSMTGSWSIQNNLLTFENINGDGWLEMRF